MIAGEYEIEISSGRLVDLQSFDASLVTIAEVAHALGMLCRFGGHAKQFYSVAEHSVLMLQWFRTCRPNSSREEQRAILMHDAPEAFLVDLPRPIKAQLPAYRHMEERLAACLAERFDTADAVVDVERYDLEMLAMEKMHVMRSENDWPSLDGVLVPNTVVPRFWDPDRARYEFAAAYSGVK